MELRVVVTFHSRIPPTGTRNQRARTGAFGVLRHDKTWPQCAFRQKVRSIQTNQSSDSNGFPPYTMREAEPAEQIVDCFDRNIQGHVFCVSVYKPVNRATAMKTTCIKNFFVSGLPRFKILYRGRWVEPFAYEAHLAQQYQATPSSSANPSPALTFSHLARCAVAMRLRESPASSAS